MNEKFKISLVELSLEAAENISGWCGIIRYS